MLADLNLQAALHNDIEFLSAVLGQMNRLLLLLGGILVANPVGLRQSLLKVRGKVLNQDAFLLGSTLSFALSRNCVRCQLSRMSFKEG